MSSQDIVLAKTKKKMGRPKTGHGTTVGVRFPPEILEWLDEWCAENKVSRSEAVRYLVHTALGAGYKID